MPFAEYKDFQDCLDKNQDKSDPEAYCGKIKNEVEGTAKKECLCKMRILKADGRFIIYGPASVEVRDREGDKIRASALQVALPQLLKRGRFSRNHEDILVGEILPEFESEGKVYKTGVLNDRLMVVGEIWGDTRAGLETQKGITENKLRSYSISGEALDVQKICDTAGCYRDISKLDLHAVTICEKGMNQAAHFSVIQKEESQEVTICVKAIDKEGKLKKLLETLQKLGNPGHSFGIIIDPDMRENTVKMGWDGDGSDKIIDIVEKSRVNKNEILMTIATPQNNVDLNSSVHTEEVLKKMTENTTTPPAVEAKKEAAPPEAGGGGGNDIGAKLDKLIAMMSQMMGAGGGDMGKAAPPAVPAVAKAPEASVVAAPAAITKADIEAILDEKFKVLAVGQTPRPIMKEQLASDNPLAAIMKDPGRLAKMTPGEIEDMFPRQEDSIW